MSATIIPPPAYRQEINEMLRPEPICSCAFDRGVFAAQSPWYQRLPYRSDQRGSFASWISPFRRPLWCWSRWGVLHRMGYAMPPLSVRFLADGPWGTVLLQNLRRIVRVDFLEDLVLHSDSVQRPV